MHSESDLLPLSALQHFLFCQRQCALIHLEQQWAENRFTAEGKPKSHRADEVQVCAQAICLEEMLNTQIPEAYLYYGVRGLKR